MVKEIQGKKDFDRLLEKSHQVPVFLIKHSTACGLSAAAWREFTELAEEESRAEFWRVLVRENRSLSRMIAEKTGIRHESPQVILFSGGQPIWNDSHLAIKLSLMKKKLDSLE